jgi:Lrp/AsnC family leucine-responsive transcriptional regulator
VDAIDEKILGILTRDGRASFSAIGREVGLSTNAAAARVRRLERAGVILGYRAILADEAPERPASAGSEAFIDVRLQVGQDSDEFLAWARAQPMVRDAVHVTGPYDYLLHVYVPDTSELDRLLRRMKKTAGVSYTQTRLALRS